MITEPEEARAACIKSCQLRTRRELPCHCKENQDKQVGAYQELDCDVDKSVR